jgi:hypothetical protein
MLPSKRLLVIGLVSREVDDRNDPGEIKSRYPQTTTHLLNHDILNHWIRKGVVEPRRRRDSLETKSRNLDRSRGTEPLALADGGTL